jgi:hypothetical protein
MTGVPGRPAWWSVRSTRAALHVLPSGGDRDRWQRELVSELYGLTRAEQARHTVGVVRRVPALRAAVTARDRTTEEDVMRKSMRCRVSLHRWRVASSDDGSYRFRRCSRCGKERTYDDPGHWAGNVGQGAG